MLFSERNTDNGNGKQNTKRKVRQTNPNATQDYPKKVHDNTQASTGLWRGFYSLTERAEGK